MKIDPCSVPFKLIALAIWCVTSTGLAQSYRVTDLGSLGGNSSLARAINNSGTVVGDAFDASGNQHAVVYSNGVLSDLGTLGGAYDINQAGQIVGAATQTAGAFLYEQGTMIDLGALLHSTNRSIASGINSAGTVVGHYFNPSKQLRPFVYANGSAQDLGFDGVANCINDVGQIGAYEEGGGNSGCLIISNGQRKYVGSLGGKITQLFRINNNGVAVGNSSTAQGTSHACLYQNGMMRDLGTLGGDSSVALGLNIQGDVVGQAKDAKDAFRAYVYRNGAMVDLNSLLPVGSGWFLTIAYGINDAGQIVGQGQINDQTHGFLLTPTPPGPTRARATATITSGFLTGITLTEHGAGYTNTPNVVVSGDGTGAKALAVMKNGSISNVIILSSGSGFTVPPLILIDPPITTPSLSVVVSSVAVTMNVVPGRRYQLDSSFDLRDWRPAGAEFSAEADTITRVFEVGTTGQYFRIQEVP